MEESSVYRSIVAEGATKGADKAKREIALDLLGKGFAVEAIARATELSLEEVQRIQQKNAFPTV